MTDPARQRREFYNLDEDGRETKNVAGKHPELVERLEQELFAWYRDVGLEEVQPVARD